MFFTILYGEGKKQKKKKSRELRRRSLLGGKKGGKKNRLQSLTAVNGRESQNDGKKQSVTEPGPFAFRHGKGSGRDRLISC